MRNFSPLNDPRMPAQEETTDIVPMALPVQAPAPVEDPLVPASYNPVAMPDPVAAPMPVNYQTTTSGVQVFPEFQKLMEKNEAERKALVDRMIVDQQKVDLANQEALNAQQTTIANETARIEAIKQEEQRKLQEKEAAAKQFEKEYAESKVDPDRFYGEGTGKRIMAAIFAGAGGFAAAMTGGRNYALEIIQDAVNKDIEMQKIDMAKKGERAEKARAEIALAQGRFENYENALAAMKFKSVENMANRAANMASNQQQKNNLLMLAQGARDKYIENMANLMPKTTSTVQVAAGTTAPKAGQKPTEAQSKAQLYASTAANAEQNFQKVVSKGFKREGLFSSLGTWLPEAIKSEDLKLTEQAELAFADAYLRQTSGAAVPEPEVKRAQTRFFPRVGDTKAVVEQKQRDRQQAIEQINLIAQGKTLGESDLLFKAQGVKYPSFQRTP